MESTQAQPAPPARAALLPALNSPRVQALLRSDTVALAAMFVALGIYYMPPGIAFAVVGAALYVALAFWKPYLTPVPIAAGMSLFYRPRSVGHYDFPIDEFLIAASVGVWVLRDGWLLLRQPAWRTTLSAGAVLQWLRETIRRPFVWAAAGFLVAGALSLVLPHPAEADAARREFRWTIIEPLLFFALLARYVRTESDIFRTLNAYLIGAALNAQVGVDQYLFGDTWSMEDVGRAFGLYPGATAFGIFIGRALAVSIALVLFLPSRDDAGLRRWRGAYALLCVPLGLGVLFSFTRGAWIGVFVSLLVITFVGGWRRIFAGLVALAAIGGPIGLVLLGGIERFALLGSSNLSRLAIWVPALRIIRDHPLTGIGPDQFLYQDPKYGVPNTRFQTVNHPHDWILDTWLRLGLWGLLLMIATIVTFFISALRAYRGRRGTVVGALILALLAGMTDHVVHGLVDQAYFTQDLALTFWMFLGLLGAILLMRPAPAVAAPVPAEAAEAAPVPAEVAA